MSVTHKIVDACYAVHKKNICDKTLPISNHGRTTLIGGAPSPITVREVKALLGEGSDRTVTPVVAAYGLIAAIQPRYLPDAETINRLKETLTRRRTTKSQRKVMFKKAFKQSKLSPTAFSKLVTLGEKDGSDYWFDDRMPAKQGKEDFRVEVGKKMSTAVLGSCFLVDLLVSGGTDMGDVLERMPKITTQKKGKKFYQNTVKKCRLPKYLFARYTSAGNSNDGTAITTRAREAEGDYAIKHDQLAVAHLLMELIKAEPKKFSRRKFVDKIEKKISSLNEANRLAEDFTA